MTDDLMADAIRRAQADLAIARAESLWPKAVEWIRGYLEPQVQRQIAQVIGTPDWPAAYHFGWGMGMRNALRRNGFGEREFGIQNLDNIYIELVEEAVDEPVVRVTSH